MIPDTTSSHLRKLTNLSVLPSQTSGFNPLHRRTLNIVYENTTDLDQYFESKEEAKYDESLAIKSLSRNELRVIDERLDLLSQLNEEEKTLALLLNKVISHDPLKISIRESFTNNFVNYLLNRMEFSKYPLILNTQPKYSFEVEGNKVSGKPEFSIEKEDQIRVIVIDESRHLNNIKLATEFSECQIGAEIVASAYTNYAYPLSAKMLQDQLIYAVRVIGTRFTFYKSLVFKTYMDALTEGTLGDAHVVTIYRFPPSDDKETLFGFDYSNQSHREIILKMLTQLKETIKRN